MQAERVPNPEEKHSAHTFDFRSIGGIDNKCQENIEILSLEGKTNGKEHRSFSKVNENSGWLWQRGIGNGFVSRHRSQDLATDGIVARMPISVRLANRQFNW